MEILQDTGHKLILFICSNFLIFYTKVKKYNVLDY